MDVPKPGTASVPMQPENLSMRRESLLITTLVEVADNLVDHYDVIDVLTVLSNRCVESLAVESAGVMLVAPEGNLQFIASSDDSIGALELHQIQADEGPCVDCFRQGVAIINQSLAGTLERWPTFTPKALEYGIKSVHCFPMRLRGRTIGALNLFRNHDGELEANDASFAQGLADISTIAIIQHETAVDAIKLNDQLSNALNSRIIIEQAKGKIAQAEASNMNEAFARLRAYSRNNNLRLTNVAQAIVTGDLPLDRLGDRGGTVAR